MALLVAEGKIRPWVDLVDRGYCKLEVIYKASLWILFISMVQNNFGFYFSTLQSSRLVFLKHLQCTSNMLLLHISQPVQFDKDHASVACV